MIEDRLAVGGARGLRVQCVLEALADLTIETTEVDVVVVTAVERTNLGTAPLVKASTQSAEPVHAVSTRGQNHLSLD